MSLRSLYFGLTGALVLTACVPAPPIPETTEPASCGAEDLATLVGQDRKVLGTMKLAGPVRVIEPGMAVTMDYSPDRLNIWIDKTGRIDSLTCG